MKPLEKIVSCMLRDAASDDIQLVQTEHRKKASVSSKSAADKAIPPQF